MKRISWIITLGVQKRIVMTKRELRLRGSFSKEIEMKDLDLSQY
jgi:hypothetical protein